MKTPSSQYSVLDGRTIDQWKVTELKEELKKRKLTIKGLKEDLVKRLDEAIRAETEDEKHTNNDIEETPQPQNADDPTKTEVDDVTVNPSQVGTVEISEVGPMNNDEGVSSGVNVPVEDDGTVNPSQVGTIEISEVGPMSNDKGVSSGVDEDDGTVNSSQVGTIEISEVGPTSNDEGVSSGVDVSVAVDGKDGSKLENQNEEKEAELTNDSKVSDYTNAVSEADTGELGPQHDKMETDNEVSEDTKLLHNQDVKLDSSDLNNQVSVVSTNLGFPVKCTNSFSTDSVSVEKNELEDNIIADNVKLESHENKVSVEDAVKNVIYPDISQKNHTADSGSPEKLNFDRSSGDESMEEDILESKQIDSNYNFEMGKKTEKSEVTTIKDEVPSAAMAIDLPAEERSIPENSNVEAPLFEKRKLPEQEVNQNNEPSKRQRRWKSENKDSEPQISNNAPTTPKDVLEPTPLKRTFNRSFSAGSNNDSPKERVVPPSTKAATASLRIDQFLRPFTLKAVQEFLGKTGTVSSFWMDHIKTHCYVTYSSVEEAVATRNAIYNLQWPPNGGRNLIAEFVDPEEVKLKVDLPPQHPAAPMGPTKAPEPQPSPRQQSLKQRMSEQPTLPPQSPPPPSQPARARPRELAQPPLKEEKVEAPIVTLDDLFRKTKAMPRIYYLPLSEEQVAVKVDGRVKSSRA